MLLTKDFVSKEYESLLNDGFLQDEICATLSFSKDGSIVVYPEKWYNQDDFSYSGRFSGINPPADGYTLYARRTDHPTEPPIKISEGIDYYQLSENGDSVVYGKGAYYRFDLKTKTETLLCTSNGFGPWVSPDNQIVYYLDKEHFMVRQNDQEPEIFIENFQLFNTPKLFSKDFRSCYYVQDEKLYQKDIGKESVLIDDGVTLGEPNTFGSYCLGDGFYYTKKNEVYYYRNGLKTLVSEDAASAVGFLEDYGAYTALDGSEKYAQNGILCDPPAQKNVQDAIALQHGEYLFEPFNDQYPIASTWIDTKHGSFYATKNEDGSAALFCQKDEKDLICQDAHPEYIVVSLNGTALYRNNNELYFYDGNYNRCIDTEVTHLFTPSGCYD